MIEQRRGKLRFRAQRRGLRELDLFMDQFTAAHLDAFDDRQLTQFEAVLDIPDQDILGWIMGRSAPPPEHRSEVLDLLLGFRYAPPAC